MFVTRVNYTGDKLFSGVNNTGEKYVPGVVDTVQEKTKKPKIYRWCQRHRRKLFICVNDTADKFFGCVSDRVLPILACLHLKTKNKQNFNL
jgi:hypothetical protein